MLRLVLSVLLAFALASVSAASVARGWSGDAGHVHAEAHSVEDHPQETRTFLDCCDAPASKGASHCLGDFAGALSLLSAQPNVSQVGYSVGAACHPETVPLNVPTGPPKA